MLPLFIPPSPLSADDHSSFYCLFQNVILLESHKYVLFSDWLFSPSDIHLCFLHVRIILNGKIYDNFFGKNKKTTSGGCSSPCNMGTALILLKEKQGAELELLEPSGPAPPTRSFSVLWSEKKYCKPEGNQACWKVRSDV